MAYCIFNVICIVVNEFNQVDWRWLPSIVSPRGKQRRKLIDAGVARNYLLLRSSTRTNKKIFF